MCHVALLLLLILYSASSEIRNKEFELVPIDRISYYGRAEGVYEICVPPAGGKQGVEWRKGNRTLKNNDRISIYASNNIKDYAKKLPRDIKKIYVLKIKPVLPEDAGIYACVDLSSQHQAMFRIILVDSCDDKFFKCLSGNVDCVANATVCDGKSDCDDASDESVDAGCSIALPTKSYNELDVPRDVYGVHIDGQSIIVCWQHVGGAAGYQIVTNFPDGSNKPFKVSQPGWVLKEVRPNSTYTFKVRQWTSLEYSKFSNKFTVKTGPRQGKTFQPVDVSVNVNKTVTLSWNDAPKGLLDANGTYPWLSCATFAIEICLRHPIYREWTTNETLISDVMVLNYWNSTNNKTEDLSLKNYTIHYEKEHAEFIRYDNVSCNVTSSDELRFEIDGLVPNSSYSYIVRIYHNNLIVGKYTEGSFTAIGYVPPRNEKRETIFTGVVVYGISCGILIVALIVSFIIAYCCKWDRLMSDVAVKKAKFKSQKQQEIDRKLKAKLLSASYINNQTKPSVKYK